jgi:hypothetical protein
MARTAKKLDFTSDFHTSLFLQKNGIYYCRIIHNATQEVIATRSTREKNESAARGVAGSLLSSLPLLEIFKDFQEKKKAKLSDSIPKGSAGQPVYTKLELKAMNVANYFIAFWDKNHSPYIQDRIMMGKPLSGKHLKESARFANDIIGTDAIFKTLPILYIDYTDIEEFFRRINQSYTPFTLKHIRETLSRGISYGSERGICRALILKDLPIPKTDGRERGSLTEEEVGKILAIETIPLWYTVDGKPEVGTRSSGKKGEKRQGIYRR